MAVYKRSKIHPDIISAELHRNNIDNLLPGWGQDISDWKPPSYSTLSLEMRVDQDFDLTELFSIADNMPRKVIVKCQHCGQYGARKTACPHCGAPID
jgi:hypothetical protein